MTHIILIKDEIPKNLKRKYKNNLLKIFCQNNLGNLIK